MITHEQLVEMFENIGKDTKWDMSRPMVWGYFFADGQRAKLARVAPLLEQQGYRLVDLYRSDKEDPSDPDLWWLHVEKTEVHSPDTLHERNLALYKFAEAQGLDCYDGMDVGPVEGRH